MARFAFFVVCGLLAVVVAAGAAGLHLLRTDLAYTHASVDLSHAAFRGLRVTLKGKDPVLRADRFEIRYNLRDLAVGSRRAFGLVAINADRPRVSLVHYTNGTWNVPFPQRSSPGPNLSFGPFVFTARIRDGSITVHDATRADPRVRDFAVTGIEVRADIDQNARSTYRVGAALVEEGRTYPFSGEGLLDDRIGYELNEWTSRSIPLSSTLNYLANSPQFDVAEGVLDDVDARYYGLAGRDGRIARHLAMHGYLRSFRVYVRNVGVPLRDGHGEIFAYDDGLVTPRIDATLAGIPLVVTGGFYDLADPAFRFGIRARGSLAQVGRLSAMLAGKHIGGDISLDALAEGSAAKPLVFVRAASRHVTYSNMPVDDAHALVAVNAMNADILNAHARYRGVTVGVRGHAVLNSTRAASEGVVHVSGSLAALPYATILTGNMRLDGTVVASGTADAFNAGGVIDGSGPGTRLDGTLRFAPSGTGTIGPLEIDRSDGSSLYARIAIDRTSGESLAIADAQQWQLRARGLHATLSGSIGAELRHAQVAALGSALAVGSGAVGMLDGSVAGSLAKPAYDLHARLVGLPLATAVALAAREIPYPEGSIDANVHVLGSGMTPRVSGTIEMPEGAVNGLPFQNVAVNLAGTLQGIAANGHATVGSTTIGFMGRYANRIASGRVSAPRADLADFNDYFDQGETLAGTGALDASFTFSSSGLASSGNVALHGLRFRRFDLGETDAVWKTRDQTVTAQASVAGRGGRFQIAGDVWPRLQFTASARDVDASEYLPLFGVNAPVTGIVDAEATVTGHYPAITASARASVSHGTIGRLPVQTLNARLSAADGRARIETANLVVPHLSVSGAGTFGLRPTDPLALTAHITSDDLGGLYNQAMGQHLDVAGTLDSTVRLGGTFLSPTLDDTLTLSGLRYGGFDVPHVAAEIAATRTSASLRNGEVDFAHGRLVASGTVPIARSGEAVQVALGARNIGLDSFAALLPKGTKIGGVLDGNLTIAGATLDPTLGGSLALQNGAFSAPFFQTPLTGIGTNVAFAGHRIAVRNAAATVGGGTISATGDVTVADLRAPMRNLAFRFDARTQNAGFNLPAYFRGKVTANVIASRTPNGPITVGGNVAIEHARIPVSAIYNPSSSKTPAVPPPIAFDHFGITVGQDVRVQSNIIDVGATGKMTVTGTLAQPVLAGGFNATGGTVDVDHEFRVQHGTIAFHPSDGLMPTIDTVATTSIDNPQTDITLHVTGVVPHLNLGLASDPTYSRAQILGLLLGVQSLGALEGVQTGSSQAITASSVAESQAEGLLRTQLTRGIFEPLQTNLGNMLGLSNLQLYPDTTGGFTANATKGLGKNLNAVFGQTFGSVSRQMIGVRTTTYHNYALQATYWQQEGAIGFDQNNPSFLQSLSTGSLNQELLSSTPATGTNGYSLAIQRRYP
jgi:autotransporter translocation and assembly factor TamB